MATSRMAIHPVRTSAILTDENGRKWRIEGEVTVANTGWRSIRLEPDHSSCDNRRSCTHYGELYL